MRAPLVNTLRLAITFILRAAKDLGAVCLGASAIFLSRAFPAFVCAECQDFDLAMLVVSASFFTVGMVMRYLGQDDGDRGDDDA